MKIKILVSTFLLIAVAVYAQREEYAGKYLGWIQMFDANKPPKPFTLDHRTWSVKQMGISYQLVKWVQQSYTPKGAVGQAFWLRNNKLGENSQNGKAMPQQYGTATKTLIELRKDASGKWIPFTNTNWFMQIAVNGGIGSEVQLISTPEQHYFNIPDNEGKNDDFIKRMGSLLGFDNHPSLKNYYHWFQPKGPSSTLQYVVLLCKDKVKPYMQINKGEYLDALAKAIERFANEQYKWIAEEKARNSRYNASATENQLTNRNAAFLRLKEKYKNRLHEPAILTQWPSMHLESEGGFDVFEEKDYAYAFPIYKFNPAMLAQSKSDTPQWVIISWDAEGIATQNEAGTNLHKSMLNNIDYDYLYNYFFYPDKVKGIAYKPLRSPENEEVVAMVEKSANAIDKEKDASVFFFEDFSATAEEKRPAGWRCTFNRNALQAVVKKLNGDKNNWVQLHGHLFEIDRPAKKLPENFTASFDVAVKKDFLWGTPGMEFFLAGKKKSQSEYENYIMVKVKPGFGEREGWATVNVKSPSKSHFPSEVAVPGFSNNKAINKTTVTIKKTGTQLQIYVGGTKVFDKNDAIPTDMLLDHFYFLEFNQGGEVEEFYVTNILIKKD